MGSPRNVDRKKTSATARERLASFAEALKPIGPAGIAKLVAGEAVVWSEMIEEDPRYARHKWGSWSCDIDLPGFGEAGVIMVVVDQPGSSQVRMVVGFPGGSRFCPCEFDIGAPSALTEGLARGDWPRAFAAAAALPSARRAN